MIKLINGCRKVHELCKEHSLLINSFAYLLYELKVCSKYTAGLLSMDFIYYKVRRKIIKKVKKIVENNKYVVDNKVNKTVWLFWWQGIKDSPDLVQACYKSVCKYFGEWNIIVIDKDNYSQYIDFPDCIVQKHNKGIITHTHFSDILRIALLGKYGGLWLDATVYCTGKIPENYLEHDLFCYRNGWMDQENINFASWLIFSKANEPILSVSLEILLEYWKNHNYLIHYFLLHMIVRVVADEMPELWKYIPYFNHNDNHLLAEELERKYDKSRYESITNLTPFHKLSYKINVDATEKSTTYYHIVFGS